MKLLSIRLHPFGGTADRTCTFREGINVLEGPNEFGKSTLGSALWHALFTPTHLTPAALRQTMGRWYPIPDGDHAQVTVRFEAGGQTWTLRKTWGAGTGSSLQPDSAAGLADPAKVQSQLLTLLRRNEATWRHVLFTSQAQLAATIEQLRTHSGKVDDIQSLLAGPAAIPGDIAPEKLTAALESRITQHFGRWDIGSNGPEKGRGIENPWANGKGPLLDAWYAMETVRRQLAQVIRHEQAVDDINTGISQITAEMATDEDFVLTGRRLRDGLGKRAGLEAKSQLLANNLKLLKEIMTAWPGAAQVVQAKESELATVHDELAALETELKTARKRSQAEQFRASHERLAKARNDWNQATLRLAASQAVDPELLAELQELELEIDKLRIQIAAQKLSATLASRATLAVQIQRGSGATETITLDPSEPWTTPAEGIFRLDYQDLTLSVTSGSGDVTRLFSALESSRTRHSQILHLLGHDSLAAARLADADQRQLITAENTAKGLYHAALQGRSEEEWSAEMAAIANLPETRSIEVIEDAKTTKLGRKAALDLEIRLEREKILTWTRDHTDPESLTDKILALSAEAQQAKQAIASLPELPEGFTSINHYLEILSQKENARETRKESLDQLKLQQATLTGNAPEHSAEDLRADLETRQRAYDRQHAEGQALLRIRTTLQAVIANRGIQDPMQGLATAVSNHFKDLTQGRYREVTLDGSSPTRVAGALILDTSLLSQGTLGSLALATRLALAALYLQDMDGFFLLDDPFTDMDHARRAAAIQALRNFARNHQVLFFTCHPQHASDLLQDPSAQPIGEI